jgi:hypothetical protein
MGRDGEIGKRTRGAVVVNDRREELHHPGDEALKDSHSINEPELEFATLSRMQMFRIRTP